MWNCYGTRLVGIWRVKEILVSPGKTKEPKVERAESNRWYMAEGRKWTYCCSVRLSRVPSSCANHSRRAFHPIKETLLMTLSLHGNISCFEVPGTAGERPNSQPKWTLSPRRMVKAATFVVGATDILACGVTSTNRGVLESWKLPDAQLYTN
jgi:hypothetical protein